MNFRKFLLIVCSVVALCSCKSQYELLLNTPIIQNGKLVGAVTHVMVANPTEGYGIFIENMLSASMLSKGQAA